MGLVIFTFFVLVAIFANSIAPYDPMKIHFIEGGGVKVVRMVFVIAVVLQAGRQDNHADYLLALLGYHVVFLLLANYPAATLVIGANCLVVDLQKGRAILIGYSGFLVYHP